MCRAILAQGLVSSILAVALVFSLAPEAGIASTGPAAPETVSRGIGEWRVGPSFDPDCHFQDIQDAIDATVANDGGLSTINIRVAGGTSVHEGNTYVVDGTQFENITTVRIIGGHADCSGPPFEGARTILDAARNGRVFQLNYEADDGDPVFTMELENLEIRNGLASFAGGGVRVRSHADLHRVRLNNVDIHSNETTSQGSGGGISIEATAPGSSPTNWVTVGQGSRIVGNHADGGGGGVACFNAADDPNPPVLLFNVPLIGNSAVANGGGISVHGCKNFSIRTAGFDQRIGSNEAGASGGSGDGGGLHVSGGADVTLEASGTSESAEMFANSANRGGGAVVVGTSSALTLVNARIQVNFADDRGGGVFVDDEAELVMGRAGGVPGFPGDCRPLEDPASRCSELFANNAPTGAGISVRGGAQATVNQTRIHLNVGDETGASAAEILDVGSLMHLEGGMIHAQQGAGRLFRIEAARLRVHWSTIAGNDDDESLSSVFQLIAGIGGHAPVIIVDSSVVWEPSVAIVSSASSNMSAAATCVIGHIDKGISGFSSTDFYSNVDPRLIDRYNGDLRLRPDSPAIDYCDDDTAPAFDDFFNRSRGIEYNLDPDIPPVDSVPGGDFDLGAFERPRTEDVLHADRFEVSP